MGVCGSTENGGGGGGAKPVVKDQPNGPKTDVVESHQVEQRPTGSSGRKQWNRKFTAAEIRDEYNFARTLGQGGSCKVVQGWKKADSKDEMAIKIMSKSSKVNATLFEHEVKILDKVRHKNIIQYIDSFQGPENYYVLTRLCGGGELFDRIVEKEFQFTEKIVSRLVKTMLEALKCCHDKNIVHRDLKPENFVFEGKERDSEMVLIDFGCAKEVLDSKRYSDLVGTPYYLAPESADAKQVRYGATLKASDVWSVGVIAYVMMTGRPPFNGKSNQDIFNSILNKPVKWPRGQGDYSSGFRDFVALVLNKDWKLRPSVDECLEHKWVKGEGTSNKAMNQEVLRCLVQFNNQSRLKKAITKTLAGNMGDQPRKKIEDHFNRLDKNGDGALDQEELHYLLTDLGYDQFNAMAEAKRIIEEADEDGDGEIGFEEFSTVWQRKLLAVNNKYANAVFNVLDHDGDGFIDAEELKQVLGLDDDRAIDAMIEEVDTNKDGKISLEEFKAAMKEDDAFGIKQQNYGAAKIDSRREDL